MWILLALLSRLFWSGTSAIDQVLTRSHESDRIRAVMALELVMDAPLALIVLGLVERSWHCPSFYGWVAFSVAALIGGLLPYYKCLQEDEAYNIVPYLEMSPVFLTVMAFLFRDERLAALQLAGAGLIVLCGFLFSWDFARGRFRLRTFSLMSLCALGYAANAFALRMAGETGGVWAASGWYLAFASLAGAAMLMGFKPRVRRAIVKKALATKGGTVAFALFSNTLSLLGLVCLLYAFALAPTMGHAAGLSGAQPFFSFFLALALGYVLPRYYEPLVFNKETKVKLFLLVGILVGAWVLARG
jgi:uncharacterized membrane protein